MTLGFGITSFNEELEIMTKNIHYIWIENNNGEDFINSLSKELGNNKILNMELIEMYD